MRQAVVKKKEEVEMKERTSNPQFRSVRDGGGSPEGRLVTHDTSSGLGVEEKPSNNGKEEVTATGSRGDRSNYPESLKRSGTSNSSCVAASVDSDAKSEVVNRLGNVVRRNGPSSNNVGHSGVQASRAYQNVGIEESKCGPIPNSEEAIGESPLSDQAEPKNSPTLEDAPGVVRGDSVGIEAKVSSDTSLPSTPSKIKSEVPAGTDKKLGRGSRLRIDPANCAHILHFDKHKPSSSLFENDKVESYGLRPEAEPKQVVCSGLSEEKVF